MLLAPPIAAQAAQPPANRLDAVNTLAAAVNSAITGLIGLLFAGTTSTGTGADTTEDTLQTFSLPANTLVGYGQTLRIRAFGTCAANTNTKLFKLYFGSEVIATPAGATNNKNWMLELLVTRTGSKTQIVHGTGIVDTTAVTPYFATGAEDDTAAITIKCTGTNGTASAGDAVCKGMIVEVLN